MSTGAPRAKPPATPTAKGGETPDDIAVAAACARSIHAHAARGGRSWSLENVWGYRNFKNCFPPILAALTEAGFEWKFSHINMADYGVPQTRKRLIVRAVHTSWRGRVPPLQATHRKGGDMFHARWVGWYAAIEDLIPDLPETQPAPWQMQRMGRLPRATTLIGAGGYEGRIIQAGTERPAFTVTSNPNQSDQIRAYLVGGGNTNLGNPTSLPRGAEEPAFTVRNGQHGSPERAYLLGDQSGSQGTGVILRAADEPAMTVRAGRKETYRADVGGRWVKITLPCLARFQTVPDSYKGLTAEINGNGVPPLFAQQRYGELTMTLPTHVIRTDGGTQPRAGIDPEHVARLREALLGGATLPPLILYHDGTDFWLADGYHRLEAHKATYPGKYISVDVRQGTRRDAVLYSTGANRDHGLPRSRDDLRRAIETLLRDEEWVAWSNREIARRVGCSDNTVRAERERLESTAQIAQSTTRKSADGRERPATQPTKAQPAARPSTHPDAVPPPPPPSEAARIRAELDALAARQAAGMFDAADQAALDDLDHSLDAAVADLDDTTYEALARDLTTLQEWSPAEPEPTGDAPLAESELADLSRLGGWEILTSKESAAGLQITMRCMHGEDGPSMAKQTRGPGGWRMELSDLRQQEAIKERNRELAKRNIAAHTPADRIPQDWDDWRSRALRLPQGELGMAHNGAISLLVAGRIDAGVREARNRWPLVCRRIVELEETYSPTPAPAPCPIAVEALVAAQRRATAAGHALGWLQERGEFALRNMAVGGLSVTYAADDWGSVLARLAELERPSAPPDVAAALATARAGMAQAAAQQEATALPPTGADGELYQRAERGPLAEILRLSPPALRLLSLIHFGGDRRDDDESTREWIWESLTSDTQALDEEALAWALGEAPAERKAAA